MGTPLCLGCGPNFVGRLARSVPGVMVRFTGNGGKRKLVIAVAVPNFLIFLIDVEFDAVEDAFQAEVETFVHGAGAAGAGGEGGCFGDASGF